ncbi:hypothetical protein [Bacillus toyonensis]|uniref:hypothetical protein n=1 Tax=Bacillus toyonensis TaxID=155322 RepID=UPI002E24FAB3|nr:hypothetical protein [Bacillus toyonensis]
MKKTPETRKCTWDFKDSIDDAVFDTITGLEQGYGTDQTLNEMMKRHTNGGLVGYESEKIHLAKSTLTKLKSNAANISKEIKAAVLELEKSISIDAASFDNIDSVSDGLSIDSEEYRKVAININNWQYDIHKIYKYIEEIEDVLSTLISENIQ